MTRELLFVNLNHLQAMSAAPRAPESEQLIKIYSAAIGVAPPPHLHPQVLWGHFQVIAEFSRDDRCQQLLELTNKMCQTNYITPTK